jgi:hypothetical protein
VLEPAVSAALDFRAMLEAALRGPSLPCIYTILFYNILSVLFVRDYQWKCQDAEYSSKLTKQQAS